MNCSCPIDPRLPKRQGRLGAPRRLGLIDVPVDLALSALRRLGNAFNHSAEAASLKDPVHSARLESLYSGARNNLLWAPLETVLAALPTLAHELLQ